MCRHMRLDRLFMNERSINKTRPLTALLQSSFLFRESRYQISLCVLFTDSPFNTEFQFRSLCHSGNYPLNWHCFQRRLTSIKLKLCCDFFILRQKYTKIVWKRFFIQNFFKCFRHFKLKQSMKLQQKRER